MCKTEYNIVEVSMNPYTEIRRYQEIKKYGNGGTFWCMNCCKKFYISSVDIQQQTQECICKKCLLDMLPKVYVINH